MLSKLQTTAAMVSSCVPERQRLRSRKTTRSIARRRRWARPTSSRFATPADGIGYTFGQAYKPGLAWPKIKLHSVTRTVNYETGSMRDEIVLSRAEALGGGGYPHTGEQRNDQYLSGTHAWNQLAERPRCPGRASSPIASISCGSRRTAR